MRVAQDAYGRATSELSAAKANLFAAECELASTRHPMKPRKGSKPTPEERARAGLGRLPRSSAAPPSERDEGLVGHVDMDGDPLMPPPAPIAADYDDPAAFERMRQRALRLERDWLPTIEANKARLWDRDLPGWTARLASAAGDAAERAREVLGRMRGRIDAAHAALGERHPLVRRMGDDLVDLVIRHAGPVRALIADETDRARTMLVEAAEVWASARQAWSRVEDRCRAEEAARTADRGPSGPTM